MKMSQICGKDIIKKVEDKLRKRSLKNIIREAVIIKKRKIGLDKVFNTRIDYDDGLQTLEIGDDDSCRVLLITDIGNLEDIMA